MKPVPVVIILILIVFIYKHSFEGEPYEPIALSSAIQVVDNTGKWYEWKTIRGVVYDLVQNRAFNELERLVNEVRTHHYRFYNTDAVLFELYNVIAIDFPDYQSIHAFIDEWRAFDPESNIPDILEARAYRAKGGDLRGNGYASLTSEEQFKGYAKFLKLALASANKAEQKGPMDAELCREQIGLAFASLKDKPLALSYFDKCMEIDPGYVHTFYTMRKFMQRIWYGSDSELQQFIEQAATDTQAIYGEGMYAILVAAHTFNTRKIFDNNGGPYSWQRAKVGFQHLLQKFGPSTFVWHKYGYCAMLAEDYDAFGEVLEAIGTSWDNDKQKYFKKQSWFNYHLRRWREYTN